MSVDNEKLESRYRLLVQPEFKTTVPDHLIARLPMQDRFLIQMVSVTEQRDAWLRSALRDGNAADRELDVRVTKLEEFVSKLTNKWSVIAYIIALSLPVFLKVIIDRLKP